ncbi:MAG: DUF4432 family protein [Clostridia bacterium]|nr:DUF4432 family protein [Clostridia bacterium]
MAIFYLKKTDFEDKERVVCENGALRATAFRYSTGVCGLTVSNARGYFTVLPYNGHQIWRASFDGIDLGMQTEVQEPADTKAFVESYGCFMMHSGLCAVGIPGPEDAHNTHGDLPEASFENARIITGEDEGGVYLAIQGSYHHYRTFSVSYLFTATLKLYENGTLIHLSVKIDNLRHAPLEYAYLCHINFRPMEGAKLIASVVPDAKSYRVHKIIPPTLPEAEAKALRTYMDAMQKTPEVHLTVNKKTQVYDPEIVTTVYYKGDEDGMAYTMQQREDGYACFVAHPINPFDNSLRWIARTSDEDAMGMVLPSTAEHLGYTHAKKKGQMKTIAADSSISMNLKLGLLVPVEAEQMRAKIEKILR